MGKILTLSAMLLCIPSLMAQPIITTQPANQAVTFPANSTNINFNVTVSGNSPLGYQWLHNGTNISDVIITTIAGGGQRMGQYGFGDGGPATNAFLYEPFGIAEDSSGNVFIADTFNNRVRKIGTNGIITTIAGTNYSSSVYYSGDGGAATNARLWYPTAVAVDGIGDILIADAGNDRIRKIDTNGVIKTLAGNGTNGYSGDGGPGTNAEIHLGSFSTCGLSCDIFGNLYFGDVANNRIRRIDTNGIINTIAGNGGGIYLGDGVQATNTGLSGPPINVTVDNLGDIFFAEQDNLVRKVDTNGVITTVAGGGSSKLNGIQATNAYIAPVGLCTDTNGNLYIGDIGTGRYQVNKVDSFGVLTTIAGNGSLGYLGDGNLATNAAVGCIDGLTFDPSGNLLLLDELYSVIRKVWLGGYPSLPINTLSPSVAGNYQVIISNAEGSVTSSVAALSLTYPPISKPFFYTNSGVVYLGIAWPVFQPSVFQLQYTTNLSGANWMNFPYTNTYSGTTSNTLIGLYDSNWANYPGKFYRLIWLQ